MTGGGRAAAVIPADHIAIDGDTAWWVPTQGILAGQLDRPCGACDGDGFCRCDYCRQKGRTDETCGMGGEDGCRGSGRHTFDISVACANPDCPHCTAGGPLDRYRASIVPGMVLPIEADSPDPFYPRVVMRDDGKQVLVMPGRQRLTIGSQFPSAARPGMWAVKLKVKETQ